MKKHTEKPKAKHVEKPSAPPPREPEPVKGEEPKPKRPWRIVVVVPGGDAPLDAQPHVRIVGANGEIVMTSENYASLAMAEGTAHRLEAATGWPIEHVDS